MENLNVLIELTSENAKMPTRGTPESAGLDFYTPVDLCIFPGRDALVPLDIKISLPAGYALIFKEKSGLSTKFKLSIGACVVDSDYRGIVHAHIFNHGVYAANFKKGDKLIQGIIVPVWLGQPVKVDNISTDTIRGEGGFGSTGK